MSAFRVTADAAAMRDIDDGIRDTVSAGKDSMEDVLTDAVAGTRYEGTYQPDHDTDDLVHADGRLVDRQHRSGRHCVDHGSAVRRHRRRVRYMSGNGGWKAGQVADMLRDGDFDANISAVLSDDETVGDVMMRLDDQDLGDGGLSELLRQQTSSDMLRDARKSGDVASMSAATGLSDSYGRGDRLRYAVGSVQTGGPTDID
jgi:hypothetical protein